MRRFLYLPILFALLVSTCGAHAVNGAGLGAGAGSSSPFLGIQINELISTGQSLSIGTPPTLSTTEIYGNLALHDSSGVYDITNPGASTLSIGSSAGPIRPDGVNQQYPTNIYGEPPDYRLIDEISIFAAATGKYSHMLDTIVGASGVGMTGIQKGGFAVSYAAAIYEVTAVHRLALALGRTHSVGVVTLTHGEADANDQVPTATYASEVVALQANYETDTKALTGQSTHVPMIASQQSSNPPIGVSGINTTALALLVAEANAPGLVFVSGPKYQYTYNADNEHLPNVQYQLLGEKYAEVYWAIANGYGWKPLQPTGFAVAGTGSSTIITITFAVPVGPIVFDSTAPHPHASGAYAAWANGRGFEVSTSGGTPLTITSATIVGSTVVLAMPATLATGTVVGYAIHSDLTTGGLFTGGFQGGAGCMGDLHDSDTFAGISGVVQPNWCVVFQSTIN